MLLRCEILKPPIQLGPFASVSQCPPYVRSSADSGGIADIGGCLEGCHNRTRPPRHSLLREPKKVM